MPWHNRCYVYTPSHVFPVAFPFPNNIRKSVDYVGMVRALYIICNIKSKLLKTPPKKIAFKLILFDKGSNMYCLTREVTTVGVYKIN